MNKPGYVELMVTAAAESQWVRRESASSRRRPRPVQPWRDLARAS